MQDSAWAVSTIAQAVLFLRASGWPWLRWWLAASILADLILRQFPRNSYPYFIGYCITVPVLLALVGAAAIEVLRLRVRPWAHGIGRLGWWLLLLAVQASILVALAVGPPAWARLPVVIWTARQAALAVLAVVLAVAWWLTRRYAVPVPVAVVRQHSFLLAYALVQVAHVLAVRQGVQAANTAALWAGAAVFVVWAVVIHAPGDVRKLEQAPDATDVRAEYEAMLEAMRRAKG